MAVTHLLLSECMNGRAMRDRILLVDDEELARLRKLWAGATPGSMGNLGSAEAAASTTSGR